MGQTSQKANEPGEKTRGQNSKGAKKPQFSYSASIAYSSY